MRKVFLLLAVTIPLLLMLGIAFIYYATSKKASTSIISPLSPTPAGGHFSIPSPAANGQYNVLLMGQGGVGHEGGGLMDSIMVVHLDTATQSAALIFIPRDTWLNLPFPGSKGTMKINESYSKGGLKLAKETVSLITGLPIQYAIVIDFNGFVKAIDSLGGIDINVAVSFDDYFYPVAGKELETCGKSSEEIATLSSTLSGFDLEKQFTCRYEHLHFDKGIVHVDGTTALKFARSRHSAQDGSDFGRGSRQQIILLGIKDKLLSLKALENVDKFFNNLVKMVKTDLDLATTKSVAGLLTNPQEYQIKRIVLSDANVLAPSKGPGGQFILIPKAGNQNWQELQNFIKNQIQ
jgi:LCP family protein required for cell wall assembly